MGDVGPMGADGTVEIPVGSGYRYPTLGMLWTHPRWAALRALLFERFGYPEWPDEPMVVDKFCPRGTAYMSPGWGAVFVNPYAEIENVVVIPAGVAEAAIATATKPTVGADQRWPTRPIPPIPGTPFSPDFWYQRLPKLDVLLAPAGTRETQCDPAAPTFGAARSCYICGAADASGETPLCEKCRGPR